MQLSPEQKKEIERRIHRSSVFQKVFGDKEGEFVLDEIDENTYYNGSAWDVDPYKHAYKAGQRSMAVFIHTIIDQDIEKARQEMEFKNE